MTPRQAIELIPQKGDMCLIDDVLSFDGRQILCVAQTKLDQLVLMHERAFSKMFWIEFGAQACAVHSLLTQEQAIKSGFIASVKNVDFYTDNAESIRIKAIMTADTETAKQYQFSLSNQRQKPICEGVVLVNHQF